LLVDAKDGQPGTELGAEFLARLVGVELAQVIEGKQWPQKCQVQVLIPSVNDGGLVLG
jgi:hypothetical protein